MARISMRLFGPGTLAVDDAVVHPHSGKVLALLAYLALEPHQLQSRERLAELFWGDRGEASARQSLRQALYSLRSIRDGALADCLEVDACEVRLLLDGTLDIDVLNFVEAAHSASGDRWREAARLYRGPLLDGRSFPDCDAFEAWLIARRQDLHAQACQNLGRLVGDGLARGDRDAALTFAEALRDLDPASESASRQLLRIFASSGETLRMEAEWRRLCRRLSDELGVAPSRDTTALYRQLRGEPPPPPTDGAAVLPERATGGPRLSEPLVRAGRAAERVYAFHQAVDLYDRALHALAAEVPRPLSREYDILMLKEAALERLGRRAEQAATIERAISAAEALDDAPRIAAARLRESGVCAYLGELARARAAAQHALQTYREVGDRPGEAEAMRELGFAEWHAEEYGAALQHAREALALHRQLGDVAGEASALHNLAEIHRGLGSPRQALSWYEQAMRLHWATGNSQGEILSLYGMGNALQQADDPDGAARQYQAALALSEARGERTMGSRALHALALHSAARADYDAALGFMRRAIETDRSIGYAHALGHDLADLAEIHLHRHEHAEARAALQEALVWFGLTENADAMDHASARLAVLEAGRVAPARPAGAWRGIKSHLPAGEGKVYCEFESPFSDPA